MGSSGQQIITLGSLHPSVIFFCPKSTKLRTIKGARIMTSARQQAANQRNAQKSTGPRTSEGKAASRANNLRHGLRAEQLLLPPESLADRAEVAEAYYQQFQPVGPVEH